MRTLIPILLVALLLAGCAAPSTDTPLPSRLAPAIPASPSPSATVRPTPSPSATDPATSADTAAPAGSDRELERLGMAAHGQVSLADVPMLDQPNYTSCGEAAFAMAWNFLHPQAPVDVATVEAAGLALGVYFPSRLPGPHGYLGTSPDGMRLLASAFAARYRANAPLAGALQLDQGSDFAQLEARGLFYRELSAGRPILVEVTDILGQPSRTVNDSHYILVTGMDFHSGRVTFNDPYIHLSTSGTYSGQGRSASWSDLWASWSRNRDILPGTNVHAGRGWYLVVH